MNRSDGLLTLRPLPSGGQLKQETAVKPGYTGRLRCPLPSLGDPENLEDHGWASSALLAGGIILWRWCIPSDIIEFFGRHRELDSGNLGRKPLKLDAWLDQFRSPEGAEVSKPFREVQLGTADRLETGLRLHHRFAPPRNFVASGERSPCGHLVYGCLIPDPGRAGSEHSIRPGPTPPSHRVQAPLDALGRLVDQMENIGSSLEHRRLARMARNGLVWVREQLDDGPGYTGVSRPDARNLTLADRLESVTGPTLRLLRSRGVVVELKQFGTEIACQPKNLGLVGRVFTNLSDAVTRGPAIERLGISWTFQESPSPSLALEIASGGSTSAFKPFRPPSRGQRDAAQVHEADGFPQAQTAHRLIAMMGGELTIRGIPKGEEGYSAQIPLRMRTAGAIGDPSGVQPETSASASRLLLVEDDPVSGEMTAILFRQLGWRVDLVENAKDGLLKLQSGRHHLALIDIHLPDRSGTELVREFHQSCPASRIPIIALTVESRPDELGRCLEAGVHSIINKPLERADVAELVALTA